MPVANMGGARMGGSGFTVMRLASKGTPLAMLQQISHTSPQPVAGAIAIQPLNAVRPIEIRTAQAIGHGVLTLQFIELWESNAWEDLIGQSGIDPNTIVDLADVFHAVTTRDDEMIIQKIIFSPFKKSASLSDLGNTRIVSYHNCVVADARDDETITLDTIIVPKTVEIWYTHARRLVLSTGAQEIPQLVGNYRPKY